MKLCAFLCLEEELRHRSGILTEVDNQIFTGIYLYSLSVLKLLLYYNLAVSLFALPCHVLPYVGFYRCKRNVRTHVYLRSVVRTYLSLELAVHFRL